MAKKRGKATPLGLKPGELLIDDDFTDTDAVFMWKDDMAEVKGRGYDPAFVTERVKKALGSPPSEMELIPESEWKSRLEELNANEACLSHVRNRGDNGSPIVSLDQNGQGFCWMYSTSHTATLDRAVRNMPYVRFSAHAGACKVKSFRDEGGWCGLSAKWWREKGCPSVTYWQEKSMSRSYDVPKTWENAALHKITEDWVDLSRDVYDQNLTFKQIATCLLTGTPCAVDFNWWGHSVCAMDLVLVEAGSWGLRIWNSWTDQWGERGTSVLRGSKALPDGAIATRATRPSMASWARSRGPQTVQAV